MRRIENRQHASWLPSGLGRSSCEGIVHYVGYFQMLCHRYRRINKLCTIDVNRKAFTLQSRPHLAIIQPEEVKGGEVLFKSNVQIDSKVFRSFIRSVFLRKTSKSFYYFSLNGFTMAVSVSDICENTKVKNSFLVSNVTHLAAILPCFQGLLIHK